MRRYIENLHTKCFIECLFAYKFIFVCRCCVNYGKDVSIIQSGRFNVLRKKFQYHIYNIPRFIFYFFFGQTQRVLLNGRDETNRVQYPIRKKKNRL